ncbi:Pyruvate/Phosphoenolpyruvate kinase-like domain-containing protein [Lasiosphaeria ovina]|uniref:Pyruvate/Phosphoenolpyruvate kinase-like domain-containing protein n=1 Tax=Lasiosphaeria ovina TaxID=92902 RepID=A0AAE0JT88_9PEZI|nr:Pyruvate/Phosphoenolpyruvate kinase-like domain-containing protein [Lasiosphaeria ovina]
MGSNFPSTRPQGMAAYRAPSLFQPHRARQAIRDAHEKKIPPMLGYYAGLSSLPITRFLAPMGYDAVWIDWEHTSCSVETMTSMVHETMFVSEGRTIPWVRVPGHDHAAIGYALDAGASIVIPQVETVEQAKHIVSAAKFGAKRNGTRSAPPFRLVPGITDAVVDAAHGDIWTNLNEQAAIMIQIETEAGVHNLDAILTAVPDIDAVWLGQLDARISMGLPGNGGMGGAEPEWTSLVEKFYATLKKHDKPFGGFGLGSPEQVKAANANASLLFIGADVLQLHAMNQRLVETRAAFATN